VLRSALSSSAQPSRVRPGPTLRAHTTELLPPSLCLRPPIAPWPPASPLPPLTLGNFGNTLAILLLLAVQGATGASVSSTAAEVTWRVQFGVGTVICAVATAYRWLYLQVSAAGAQQGHSMSTA